MEPILKLHPADEVEPDALRFERRRNDRWPDHRVAVVHEAAGTGFGRRHVLRLTDRSCDGVGAFCDTVLAPGTIVSFSLQDPGEPMRRGVVARSNPCGAGYRIAVVFEQRAAA